MTSLRYWNEDLKEMKEDGNGDEGGGEVDGGWRWRREESRRG